MEDHHQSLQRILQSDIQLISAMTKSCSAQQAAEKGCSLSNLELRDYSDFTEPLGSRDLSFLVSEELVKQGVIRLLQQTDKLWWHRVL